jgi:extracellular factor (EF) 3-hydroxypalmitic acid methyl ester biosynthesis protein
VTLPLHSVRTYEELDGAHGREIFFRPHRHRAAEFLPLRGVVTVGARVCPLVDLSQNGAALEWPRGQPVAVGDPQERVVVRFDDLTVYDGEARVGSVREADGASTVGISFAGLISIDEILNLRVIKGFAEGAPVTQPWRAPGQETFKVLVAELALRMEDASHELQKLESDLPWHVLNDESSAARQALIATLRRGIAAEIVGALEQADRAVRSAPPAHAPALRDYSRRHLHDFLMLAPAAHRAYHKPFGYPGDYEVMRFLYERPFEGSTLFAKAVSLAVDQMAASRAVRTRKDLVKRRLKARLEHRQTPLHVLAIASGPAQELSELLQEIPELPAPLEMVLFDQDKAALAYAYRRLQPLCERRQGEVKVIYLHESIKRLLRDQTLFDGFGKFDLIYSAGLFDYLRTPTCVQLAHGFYSRLAPGGELLVANMAPDNPSRWYMEHHLDWHLLYRSRAELLELGSAAAPGASQQLLEEETGVNPFIEISRS